MRSLLVGGRGDEEEHDVGPWRRLPPRGLLVAGVASVATALAVAVPTLLADRGGSGSQEPPLVSGTGWQSVRVCRTEPSGPCLVRGAAEAERLAGLLLPLRPVPEERVTCLAVGERYTVLLAGPPDAPPELTVDTACGPVLAGGERYEVSAEARAAVAATWAGG